MYFKLSQDWFQVLKYQGVLSFLVKNQYFAYEMKFDRYEFKAGQKLETKIQISKILLKKSKVVNINYSLIPPRTAIG